MKALHIGLIVVGAALAGGLAVRLTEPPQIAISTPFVQPPAVQPPPVAPSVTQPPAPATRWRPAEPAIASAPPPVYTVPTPPATVPHPIRPRPFPTPQLEAKAVPLPKPVPYQAPPPAAVPQPREEPRRQVTLQVGDAVAVRMAEPLSAQRVSVGGLFKGVLAEPLIADGLIVGERGAQVSGRVIAINHDALTLRLLNFQTADGQRIEISTEPVTILSGNILRFRLAARTTITERKT